MFQQAGDARKALPRYFDILEGRANAKFLERQDLSIKVADADLIFNNCEFCERKCHVNRSQAERGFCQVLRANITSEFLHLGEEPELIPSHTVFFAGCTFKCVFCQNWDISQNSESGLYIEPKSLAAIFKQKKGKNINWVGGDPTPNLNYILRVLTFLDGNIPQIWNSNMYLSEKSIKLLDAVIDVYLTDFKYGCDECAIRLSNAPNYWKIITRNHLLADKQAELLIRHLVLPGHFECCTKPILDWIVKNLENVRVNVMDQYRPEYKASDYEEISNKLTQKEYSPAYAYAKELGLNLV